MRTTSAEVIKILDNTALSTTIVDAFIGSANVMVTQILGTNLSTTVLAEIEKWLTAHLIASTRERQAKKEGAGGAEIEYTGKFAFGLTLTTYGQMVLALDTTGAMAEASTMAGDTPKKAAWLRSITSFET